jgi:tetratricopeptide (TPR) repeat protein
MTLRAAASSSETAGSVPAIKDGTAELVKAIEELQAGLRDLQVQAELFEHTHSRDILGSKDYWIGLRHELLEAEHRSAEDALSIWIKAFSEAFAAWKLDACETLIGDEFSAFPELKNVVEELRGMITAIRSNNHADAIRGLTLLVDEHPAGLTRSPVEQANLAAILLARGRIKLYDTEDADEALECFERAREAAPQDGRVYAALAEYHDHKGDAASMRDLYRRAMAVSPDKPDGYIGMALSCEAQGWWEEAQHWYAQSIHAVLRNTAVDDPTTQMGQLFAPVSGALYLSLAQAVAKTNPTAALVALDRAINLGIKGAGKYPERAAYQLKGEILEQQQRPSDAAEAFFQTGRYLSWESNAPLACEFLERSNRLDPQLVHNYWSWADAILVTSISSKPPYTDRDKIARSLDVWNRGFAISPPDDAHGWAYITRGFIAWRLANLLNEDRWERSWEAISFLEQSLLLDPTRAYAWVTLGQMLYALGNDLNAERATETALLCDPEDVSSIEERIIFLTNLDRYGEVRPLIAKRGTMEPKAYGWLKAIEAHIMLRETQGGSDPRGYELALVASDAAREAGWEASWYRVDRAQLLHSLGRPDDARKEYEDLWGKFDPQDTEAQMSRAWAGLMTGKSDEALRILQGLEKERGGDSVAVQRYLGFCQLLHGELARAQKHFDQSIALANSTRELNAWLVADVESDEVRQRLAGTAHAEAGPELLDRSKAAAGERRRTLHFPESPQEEMRQFIAGLAAKNETSGWSWLGAHVTLARLLLESHAWEDAAESYRRLQDDSERFHSARRGLQQASYGSLMEKQTMDRVTAKAQAPDREGILASAAGLLPEDRSGLAKFFSEMDVLERNRRPTRLFGQSGMQRVPAVTPIAIEAAMNLKNLLVVNGDLEPQFAQEIKRLRRTFEEILGFSIPSVRVRMNESDMPPGSYLIMIGEIPLVMETVSLTRGLCDQTVDWLKDHSIRGEEAVNPANGTECAWIEQEDWPRAKEAGASVWTPAQYIGLHLSGVIRKNATELIGIQAAADLLSQGVPEKRSLILASPGGLPRFTSVLQALLAEEVSIKPLPSICDCYLENITLPTHEIAEKIRSVEAVRGSLPGNTPNAPIYRLGEDLASLIADGIQRNGEATVLALEPQPTQDALAAFRADVAKLAPTAKNPSLFVEDWQMRPFVRKLVELEFPHLAVLSRREVSSPDTRPALGTITLASRSRIQRA